jgi:hypothetical protein
LVFALPFSTKPSQTFTIVNYNGHETENFLSGNFLLSHTSSSDKFSISPLMFRWFYASLEEIYAPQYFNNAAYIVVSFTQVLLYVFYIDMSSILANVHFEIMEL